MLQMKIAIKYEDFDKNFIDRWSMNFKRLGNLNYPVYKKKCKNIFKPYETPKSPLLMVKW